LGPFFFSSSTELGMAWPLAHSTLSTGATHGTVVGARGMAVGPLLLQHGMASGPVLPLH